MCVCVCDDVCVCECVCMCVCVCVCQPDSALVKVMAPVNLTVRCREVRGCIFRLLHGLIVIRKRTHVLSPSE